MIAIAVSSVSYFTLYHINAWLFASLELHAGANYIYLPAGLRLLCTLLMGAEGAVGLFLGSVAISATSEPSMNFITLLGSPIISAGIPYIIYRTALFYGMASSLENLSVKSLFFLIFTYSFASACGHSIWFWLHGVSDNFLGTLSAMFIGDLGGTLTIIYSIKIYLSLSDRFREKIKLTKKDQ